MHGILPQPMANLQTFGDSICSRKSKPFKRFIFHGPKWLSKITFALTLWDQRINTHDGSMGQKVYSPTWMVGGSKNKFQRYYPKWVCKMVIYPLGSQSVKSHPKKNESSYKWSCFTPIIGRKELDNLGFFHPYKWRFVERTYHNPTSTFFNFKWKILRWSIASWEVPHWTIVVIRITWWRLINSWHPQCHPLPRNECFLRDDDDGG